MLVTIQNLDKWRLIGFYRAPERNRRKESWQLIRSLSALSNLPCCCIRDFNDILDQSKKNGLRKQLEWLIQGFRSAVVDAKLMDLALIGSPFTWEIGRGTENWVQEKLDRAFVCIKWKYIFPYVKVKTIEVSVSDHLPIFLQVYNNSRSGTCRGFCFENLWIRETGCMEVVERGWHSKNLRDIYEKIINCGCVLEDWGRTIWGNFRKRIKD